MFVPGKSDDLYLLKVLSVQNIYFWHLVADGNDTVTILFMYSTFIVIHLK